MTSPTRIDMPEAGGGYPIFCGAGAAACASDFFAPGKVAVVACDSVWNQHGGEKRMQKTFGDVSYEAMTLPPGERHKTLQTAAKIADFLADIGMHRDGTVVAVGGGVAGDVAGFAAAIYMRGVRLIQIPTTLLAQADAAIGGKTGVNHPRGKNMLGAFYPPAAVCCDTDFLETLSDREYRNGLAEVVKHALLDGEDFFSWMENNADKILRRDNEAAQTMLARSAKFKANTVAADQRETGGQRALLNLGHTFAHGLETAAGYGEWLHGEAVAAGLVAAARLSEELLQFSAADTSRIVALLKKLQLPFSFRGMDSEKVFSAMAMDKKFTAAVPRFVLLHKIGRAELREVGDLRPVKKIMEGMQ